MAIVRRASAAGATKQRHDSPPIEPLGKMRERLVGWPHDRRRGQEPVRDWLLKRLQRDVARDHHDGDSPLADGDAHGAQQDLRQLIRVRHEFDVVAALLEQALGMGRLEIVDANLGARDVGRDRESTARDCVTPQMNRSRDGVAVPASAGTDRQLAGQGAPPPGREGQHALLIAHVDPGSIVFEAPECVGEAVQESPTNCRRYASHPPRRVPRPWRNPHAVLLIV